MKRRAVTLAPRFAGADHRVFVGLSLDAASAVVGVHIEAATDGSFAHEHCRTAVLLADLALRHGAPLADIAALLRDTRGESLRAVEDCEGVAEAWGVLDLVGRILERGLAPQEQP